MPNSLYGRSVKSAVKSLILGNFLIACLGKGSHFNCDWISHDKYCDILSRHPCEVLSAYLQVHTALWRVLSTPSHPRSRLCYLDTNQTSTDQIDWVGKACPDSPCEIFGRCHSFITAWVVAGEWLVLSSTWCVISWWFLKTVRFLCALDHHLTHL